MESVLEEYRSSLEDLTFNSKPLINMLTVLAEENYSYAPDLVRLIESQVYQSPPNQRLPVLYLIDSIVKSYGPYIKLFSANLIKTFLFVFEKADTKVRHDLFKLRTTWNGMFPKILLHDLDKAVRQFDPNWPVKKMNKKSDKKKSEKDKSGKSVHPSGLTVEERVAAMMGKSSESVGKFSSDEDEYNASYQEDNDESNSNEGGEFLVEEEEILVDEEKYDELEALEKELLKRKAVLSRLESFDDKPTSSGKVDPPVEKSPVTQVPYFIDINSKHEESSTAVSVLEPKKEKVERKEDTLQEIKKIPGIADELFKIRPSRNSTPDDLFISERKEMSTQTEKKITEDRESQIVVDMKDETTQYRYRKKTKNFLSQYRVPSKSVATYFRIKTKEAQTQYAPPLDIHGITADNTSGHLDGVSGLFNNKERSALKDYVAALKDDFLPAGYAKHSGIALRNLCIQRRQGILCDITLGAEGRVFKAHRSILAASSDFFYTLFAHEQIEKTPLSHIELQGVSAKALSLVLDYIYTSVLPIGSLTSVDEIVITAKRLQIQTLIATCPALEQAVSRKIDMAGWLISNASLLSPSNKHPYVEALRSLRDLESSASYLSANYGKFSQNLHSGGGDAGAGDFICHVDRDMSSKKRTADMAGYDPYSIEEGKYKKRRKYDRGSDTESDFEMAGVLKADAKKDEKYQAGIVASPGMPPSSWSEAYSPVKTKKKKKRTSDAPAPREQAVYKCNNCSRHIISRRNYISHCDAHLRKGEKPYGCGICKKTFWKEPILESHIRKLHTELSEQEIEQLTKSKVSSPDAEEVLKQREQYSPSSAKQKATKLSSRKCPECKITLPDESAFSRHMKIRHPQIAGDFKFRCHYCKQYFKTASARTSHMKRHKKEGEVPEKGTKQNYDRHSDSDNDESSLDGNEVLNSSFEEDQKDSKKNLNNAKNAPGDSQDSEAAIKLKLYHCDICGEMFSIQCFYKAHVAGHKKDLDS